MGSDRASNLVIACAACNQQKGSKTAEEFGYEDDQEEEDYEILVPPVPPDFGKLTAAQQSLAELLQVPEELLLAASQHSIGAMPSTQTDDFATWIKLLPAESKNEYLLRLAHNEPGLSRLFIRDLRAVAEQFNVSREFQERFRTWVQAYSLRPGLIKRLQNYKFAVP